MLQLENIKTSKNQKKDVKRFPVVWVLLFYNVRQPHAYRNTSSIAVYNIKSQIREVTKHQPSIILNPLVARKTENIDNVTIIQRATHMKQCYNNPSGDVYRTVLYYRKKGGYNKAVLKLGTCYINITYKISSVWGDYRLT